MAHISNITMALAEKETLISPDVLMGARDSESDRAAINTHHHGHHHRHLHSDPDHSHGKDHLPLALLTPPQSISPEMSALLSPPPPPHNTTISSSAPDLSLLPVGEGVPLSKTALSGLDASTTITPSLLAQHHLPGIMLGAGPRPIRYVMGELTHSVPGFSRIPAAKARRLVVAALESRRGGGPDGRVAFCKTGWGRWDAHIKGSSSSAGAGSFCRDSGIGSYPDNPAGHLSPPRSDGGRSSYALSSGDSGVHMPAPPRVASTTSMTSHHHHHHHHQPGQRCYSSSYRHHHYQNSRRFPYAESTSLREADEEEDEEDDDLDLPLPPDMDMDMDMAEDMSLDGSTSDHDGDGLDDTTSSNDDTDDDDWAQVGPAALRKASLPGPGAKRMDYNAISSSLQSSHHHHHASWRARLPQRGQRRTSNCAQGLSTQRRPSQISSSVVARPPPFDNDVSAPDFTMMKSPRLATSTPEEKAAVAALMSLLGGGGSSV